MQDKIKLIMEQLEILRSQAHCKYSGGDCWAGTCKGCPDYSIDADDFEFTMNEIYKIIDNEDMN